MKAIEFARIVNQLAALRPNAIVVVWDKEKEDYLPATLNTLVLIRDEGDDIVIPVIGVEDK